MGHTFYILVYLELVNDASVQIEGDLRDQRICFVF